MVTTGVSRVLDLSGGDRVLQEYVRELALMEFCRDFGVIATVAVYLGPDMEDFRHATQLLTSGELKSDRTVLVLNEGVIRMGQTTRGAFDAIMLQPEFETLCESGARVLMIPRLTCMAVLRERKLGFFDVLDRSPGGAGEHVSPTLHHMTKTWLALVERRAGAGASGRMDALTSPSDELRAAAALLIRDGRAEGIEPDGPLGRWLEAQAGSLKGLAGALDSQAQRIETVLSDVQAASRIELDKLKTALEAAQVSVRQSEQALARARTAQVASTSHHQEVAQRMIDETLPMFAMKLKDLLVMRELRLGKERLWRAAMMAGLGSMALFGAGFALATWMDSDRLAVFERCLASPLQSGGHIYCALDQAAANVAGQR